MCLRAFFRIPHDFTSLRMKQKLYLAKFMVKLTKAARPIPDAFANGRGIDTIVPAIRPDCGVHMVRQ